MKFSNAVRGKYLIVSDYKSEGFDIDLPDFIKKGVPSKWEDISWHQDSVATFWNKDIKVGVQVNRKEGDREPELTKWLYVVPGMLDDQGQAVPDARVLVETDDEKKAYQAIENYLKVHAPKRS